MTNEQAKSELMQIYMSLSEEKKKAIDVLMAQNCDQCEVGNPCLYCEYEFKAQADGEYISRQAVIDQLHQSINLLEAEDRIKELPSVAIPSAEPKTGHWITTRTFMHDGEFYCDKCKCESPNNEKWDYCPNCGARMVGDKNGR